MLTGVYTVLSAGQEAERNAYLGAGMRPQERLCGVQGCPGGIPGSLLSPRFSALSGYFALNHWTSETGDAEALDQ